MDKPGAGPIAPGGGPPDLGAHRWRRSRREAPASSSPGCRVKHAKGGRPSDPEVRSHRLNERQR